MGMWGRGEGRWKGEGLRGAVSAAVAVKVGGDSAEHDRLEPADRLVRSRMHGFVDLQA